MDILKELQVEKIREELDNCKRPLFFFDDDADGLSSFLLLYRYVKEGKGIVVKTTPNIDDKFLRKVKEYDPDKIFVLDIARIEQDFIDKVKIPIVWIDHHGPYEREGNIKYFNPRMIKKDVFLPTTRICYEVVKQDIWLAMVGCTGDYYYADFIEEFRKKYPDLINGSDDVQELYFDTKVGTLIDVFSFIMKGKANEAMKYVKVMTRIDDPNEILNEESARGKFVYKKYLKIKKDYDELLKDAMKVEPEDGFLVYIYPSSRMSFTSELSNELLYKYPEHVIVAGRENNGEIKFSLRTNTKKIPEALEKSLQGLEGFGGGHENACGANVKKEDFPEFLKRFKELMG